MIEFKEAQIAVQRKVSKEIDWFNDTNEKHFDGAAFVVEISGLLITAFLAGFVQTAKDKVEKTGVQVFQKLEIFIKNLFRSKKPEDETLTELSEKTAETLQDLSNDQMELYLNITEENMRIYLETTMPVDRATSLARLIRQSIENQFTKANT